MEATNPIYPILDQFALRPRTGEHPLTVNISPGRLQEVVEALRDHRNVFAPVVAGVTDIAPIADMYESVRKDNQPHQTVLLLVECLSLDEFREAIDKMPRRTSSDWRHPRLAPE